MNTKVSDKVHFLQLIKFLIDEESSDDDDSDDNDDGDNGNDGPGIILIPPYVALIYKDIPWPPAAVGGGSVLAGAALAAAAGVSAGVLATTALGICVNLN